MIQRVEEQLPPHDEPRVLYASRAISQPRQSLAVRSARVGGRQKDGRTAAAIAGRPLRAAGLRPPLSRPPPCRARPRSMRRWSGSCLASSVRPGGAARPGPARRAQRMALSGMQSEPAAPEQPRCGSGGTGTAGHGPTAPGSPEPRLRVLRPGPSDIACQAP
ncbi:unnamed protein product [Coccothraustes coccothraustes]